MRAALTASLCAVVMMACDAPASRAPSDRDPMSGELELRLTLPSGEAIDTISFTVEGALLSSARVGTVHVADSTVASLRVGDLPVGAGYTMSLAAVTAGGETCSGSAPFAILSAGVTALSMTLVCGGEGAGVDEDDNGDLEANINVVIEESVACPVVTGITTLPLEALTGSAITLVGYPSSAAETYAWTGPGGSFSSPSTEATSYTCAVPGHHVLTFELSAAGCPPSGQSVTVTCTAAAGVITGDAACDACLNIACRDYEGASYDLIEACLESSDPVANQLCADAFYCNLNTDDPCKDDIAYGAIACFCGAGVTPGAACQTAPGPQGPCRAEWSAAAGCDPLDATCTQNLFLDIERPSGNANYLWTCKNAACGVGAGPDAPCSVIDP